MSEQQQTMLDVLLGVMNEPRPYHWLATLRDNGKRFELLVDESNLLHVLGPDGFVADEQWPRSLRR